MRSLNLSETIQETVQIVIQLINLLLALVNDTFDMQAIYENKFKAKYEKFSPIEALQFAHRLFSAQCKIQNVELNLIAGHTGEESELLQAHDYQAMLEVVGNQPRKLPEFLYGDQVRFKQVLINVIKTFLSGISKCKASIEAHYDQQSQQVWVMLEKETGQIGASTFVSDESRSDNYFKRSLADSIGPLLCQRIVKELGGEFLVERHDDNRRGVSICFSMKMDQTELKDQQFADISRLLRANSCEDVKSQKDQSLADLNDDKLNQSSDRPMMIDALSERQGGQLIVQEEQKAPKSEKQPGQIGKLTLLDNSHRSSDEDDFSFGFSMDNFSDLRAQE